MSPLEVKNLLTKIGFSGLSLVSTSEETKTHTFKRPNGDAGSMYWKSLNLFNKSGLPHMRYLPKG